MNRVISPNAMEQRRSRRRRGQALVELAILLPVLLLLLVLAIDFGRVFFTYIGVGNAAREGAAYAAMNPGDDVGTRTQAEAEIGDPVITVEPTCDPSCTSSTGMDASGHHTVTVTVTTTFDFLTPLMNGLSGGGLQISQSATAVIP
ncbi:MAG: TadE/TadG family type IV pilus assembly protein [Candidatus Limnocylindria bacterium]